jgi:2,3-bisphosphoglycerate-independent phosphoglycerate mutase
MSAPPVLMLFVDGIGLPSNPDTPTPLRPDVCPRLIALLAEDTVATDASLGIPGLPQSATGQTAILTGINAPAICGRHVEGFPGESLREIIRRHNIYRQLADAGFVSTFANGYLATSPEEVHAARVKSVTTVAALSAFGDVRRLHHLMRHEAVAHDLTRESLGTRGYTGPCIPPEQAAGDLAAIASGHAFTLFEFFQTDRAGHREDLAAAEAVLRKFDRFLTALLRLTDAAGMLLVLTSDHGNIEDASAQTHTLNPVPFSARGPGGESLRREVRDLTDITPAILRYITTTGSSITKQAPPPTGDSARITP